MKNRASRFAISKSLSLILFFAFVTGAEESVALIQNSAESPLSIVAQKEMVPGQSVPGFQIQGLTADDLAAAGKLNFDSVPGRSLIQVVGTDGQTPVLGQTRLYQKTLYFEPRFSLGVCSRVEFHIDRLREDAVSPIVLVVQPKALGVASVPHLKFIAPGKETVPQNILRMYLQFSIPMQQGRAYEYVHFLNQNGQKIDSPFLEIPQELWNADGTRLTLLFDPGRIKQGLAKHHEMGPPFKKDSAYTLVVSKDWPSENVNPERRRALGHEFRHSFKVVRPDTVQPLVERWDLTPPSETNRQPLHIRFDEPLDIGMLRHSLTVFAVDGAKVETSVAGETKVGKDGLEWRFVPDQPWSAGEFVVRVNPRLEDVAGNSLAQPFERIIEQGQTEPAARPEPRTTLTFRVKQKSR